ncbi:MAG: hypothetical protein Q8765_02000 [Sweet potato little leaf phytoplasma]|nr:hypothetical protein [Sweet potato little leaf phytoplasma]MDV3145648.1 hypothetical protein [Sweet potato little leaf phytoplasma]
MIIDLNNKIKDLKLYDFVIEKIAQKSKNQLDLKLYHPALNFSIQAKFEKKFNLKLTNLELDDLINETILRLKKYIDLQYDSNDSELIIEKENDIIINELKEKINAYIKDDLILNNFIKQYSFINSEVQSIYEEF